MEKNLDKWLEKKKITRGDFAAAVGVDYNTAARWFGGAKIRRPKKLARAAIKARYPDCPLLKYEAKTGKA